MDWTLFIADLWCLLVVEMHYLRCFVASYDARTGHVIKNTTLMALIQVSGAGFHTYWEK